MTEERREYQRLHLTRPADGWFGDFPIRLLEVSARGALVEHDEDIPSGARALLRFFWRDREVEIMAETVRTADGRSGLTFVEDSEPLRNLIAHSAIEVLKAQEANAMGLRDLNVVGDATLTAASEAGRGLITGFTTFTLDDAGAWKRRPSLLPDQPPNGFTIPAAESEEQIEILCRSYETGDAEARRIIRMLAELSVAKAR